MHSIAFVPNCFLGLFETQCFGVVLFGLFYISACDGRGDSVIDWTSLENPPPPTPLHNPEELWVPDKSSAVHVRWT